MIARLAPLCAFLAALCVAQSDPSSTRGATTDPAILQLRARIAEDPAVSDAVAQRIARSQLSQFLTPAVDKEARIAAALRWAGEDPDSAARVMIGLLGDDAHGETTYESSLTHQLQVQYEHNPGAQKNLYNRLRRTAHDSKLLKKQSEEVSDDEKREILRAIFEGKGNAGNKTLREKPEGGSAGEKSSLPATSFNGIYDRLSAGNLKGYSPQLLALQNALNQHRPPGAPLLVETGTLDFPTLSYPAHGMRFDLKNLDERLRRDRLLSLARLAGVSPTPNDWNDPGFEDRLRRLAPARELPKRLKNRIEFIAKGRAALVQFLETAEKSKNPGGLSKDLLIALGNQQREAARWIAASALEEELSRWEDLENFLTPELLAAIQDVPAAASIRDAYVARGAGLKDRVIQLKSNAQKALDSLRSNEWSTRLAAVDGMISENRRLKKDLSADIGEYSSTPFEIRGARYEQPRWREFFDDCAVRWFPGLAYSRSIVIRRGRLRVLLETFSTIAYSRSSTTESSSMR